jgi:hypothetical protein
MKVFYCKISATQEHFGGFAVVAAFNRGHAVKLINKKLEAESKDALTGRILVEELDLDNKKGTVALEFLEGLH